MSKTDLKTDFRVAPQSPTTCGNTLLLGDHSISRSVLLLAAVTAAETGMKVVFFTQTKIQSLPVSLQKCFPTLSPESLKVSLLKAAQRVKSLFRSALQRVFKL